MDATTLASNTLIGVTTRFLRFYPKTWVGSYAMRVEVYADPGGTSVSLAFSCVTFSYFGLLAQNNFKRNAGKYSVDIKCEV